jgi:hypothetical protein
MRAANSKVLIGEGISAALVHEQLSPLMRIHRRDREPNLAHRVHDLLHGRGRQRFDGGEIVFMAVALMHVAHMLNHRLGSGCSLVFLWAVTVERLRNGHA